MKVVLTCKNSIAKLYKVVDCAQIYNFIPNSDCFIFFIFYFLGFFLFCFNLFIYLFLAVLGLRCCTRAFSSCGERRLLFVAVRRLLIAVASLVAEHGL